MRTFLRPCESKLCLYDMIWRKTCFIQSNTATIQAILIEIASSNNQSVFTWPSSLLLALYLVSNPNLVANSSVIEIGAGNALPSIVAGKIGCKHLTISDRSDTEVQSIINHTILANSLQDIAKAVPLPWGSWDNEVYETPFDVILGADVFYSTEDFDSVLLTVLQLFEKNPEAIFVSSYQERR